MAWNGSGVFARLYNFVADAAAGTKILASKQDAEWANMVTGLNNALCKDGQNSPSANVNWGGKKITNLANGSAATDAATVGQITSSEWVAETLGLTYVSATSFKVLAADKTSTYHVGRRIKTTNTGGTVYSTVKTTSYSAPDTTLTVTNDGVGVLDAGLSTLSYGLLSYVNSSYFDPRTAVEYYKTADQSYTSGTTKVALDTASVDALSETGSNKVTIKFPGVYLITAGLEFQCTSSGVVYAQVMLYKDGGSIKVAGNNDGVTRAALGIINQSISTVQTLAAGAYLELYALSNSAGTIRCGATLNTKLTVTRLA